MARKTYEKAHGVVPIEWAPGHPPTDHGVFVVEVWRSETEIAYNEVNRPHIRVDAEQELWTRKDGKWWAIGSEGRMVEAQSGEVRRHARLTSRWWRATINIDGWND